MENEFSKYMEVAVHQEEDGEALKETLWALPVREKVFSLENVPFEIYYHAVGDLVEAEIQDGSWVVQQILQPSGHSVVRVIVVAQDHFLKVKNHLASLGCESEMVAAELLLAVDIPLKVSFQEIETWLEQEAEMERLDYEVACLSEHHQGGGKITD